MRFDITTQTKQLKVSIKFSYEKRKTKKQPFPEGPSWDRTFQPFKEGGFMRIKDITDMPVFIVKPRTHHSIDEIFALFDSELKAAQFINRFKTKDKELIIVTQTLNPSYFQDPDADPYYITLDKVSFVPKQIFICSTITMVEDAKKEDYSIFFYGTNEETEGEFTFQCMAADKNEALSKAVAKRALVIDNGDWNRALQLHMKQGSTSK